jgi:hypothetical protein
MMPAFAHAAITLLSENSRPRFRVVNVTDILAIPFYRVDTEECGRGDRIYLQLSSW